MTTWSSCQSHNLVARYHTCKKTCRARFQQSGIASYADADRHDGVRGTATRNIRDPYSVKNLEWITRRVAHIRSTILFLFARAYQRHMLLIQPPKPWQRRRPHIVTASRRRGSLVSHCTGYRAVAGHCQLPIRPFAGPLYVPIHTNFGSLSLLLLRFLACR